MYFFTYSLTGLIILFLTKKFKFINIVQYYIYKSTKKKNNNKELPVYILCKNYKTSKGPPLGKVISTDDLKVLN